MKVTVNGQPKELPQAKTIADVVGTFCTNSKSIIAEINGTIVRPDRWSSTSIKDGDTIELVSFVGGG